MSHGKLREDKTCLNCGHLVEEKYCPHCGQENTETRQPFYFLFTHFIEDFTHYDGQFWKTIQYLLFRPGKLTKEYLAGKRQLYVAPVKLYIFISFITFLLPGFLPSPTVHKEKDVQSKVENVEQQQKQTEKALENLEKEGILTSENVSKTKKMLDTIKSNSLKPQKEKDVDDLLDKTLSKNSSTFLEAHNIREYDSLHVKTKKSIYSYLRPFAKKFFELKEEGLTQKEISEKFKETFIHTIPKALFIYLPIFAFFLWIFHNKKKWWYFDHGIFTLHYFSFLLLGILISMIISCISDFLDYPVINTLFGLLIAILIIYLSVYFFIAHHRVYETRRRTSVLKGFVLFIINLFGLIFMLCILTLVSFLLMH